MILKTNWQWPVAKPFPDFMLVANMDNHILIRYARSLIQWRLHIFLVWLAISIFTLAIGRFTFQHIFPPFRPGPSIVAAQCNIPWILGCFALVVLETQFCICAVPRASLRIQLQWFLPHPAEPRQRHPHGKGSSLLRFGMLRRDSHLFSFSTQQACSAFTSHKSWKSAHTASSFVVS